MKLYCPEPSAEATRHDEEERPLSKITDQIICKSHPQNTESFVSVAKLILKEHSLPAHGVTGVQVQLSLKV